MDNTISEQIKNLYGLGSLIPKYQNSPEPFWLIKLKMENQMAQSTKTKKLTWLDQPIDIAYYSSKNTN